MVYLVLLAMAVGYLVLEQQLHLRRAGIRTFAKTTGDHPEIILPDGRPTRIRRRGSARIQEQVAFIAAAARENAGAVVVECMALEPHLQDVSERAMVRSTIGVITNVRPDHFEVMGRSLDQVAQALRGTIPAGAVLVTESGPYQSLLQERCEAAGTRICVPATDDAGSGETPHLSVLGNCPQAHALPTGLLPPGIRSTGPGCGVIFRMAAAGVPVIHLLDIRKIARDYGLPVDPVPLPAVPDGRVMSQGGYSRTAALIGLVVLGVLGGMVTLWKNRDIRNC